ncbi:MAG: 3-oxoacyl-ACP synthase III family protein [Promethearchaeota archaeon]
MMSRFESIGAYFPEKVITTRELVDSLENELEIDLQRITGIKNRRMRAEGEDSFTMALAAAKDCLKNSKYEASDLDVIINTAITRFDDGLKFVIDPPISLKLKKELGANRAISFDITNACAGMMTGVQILDNMIRAGVIKNGMVISGECITPITDTAVKEIREGLDPQFASLTVGDSGIAIILDMSKNANEGIEGIDLTTFAKFSELCYGMPSDKNPGVAMYTDAIGIHAAALGRLPVYTEKMMIREGYKLSDFDYVIPHQTSVKAIKMGFEAIRKQLNAPKDEIPEVLLSVDEYGNTSSTAVMVALYKSLKEDTFKPYSRVVFFAMASGLVLGFIVAKIGDLKIKEGIESAEEQFLDMEV